MSRIPSGLRVAALLLCAAVLLPGCSRNPVTGKSQLLLMSEDDDRRADDQGAQAVEAQIGIVEDAELNAYLDELGQALAANSPRQNVRYHFHVVAMDEPNAFALPGGHIYISRGLLALANSEAELANVLGHEIGHVAARHAAQRDALEKLMSVMTVIGYIGAAAGGATHNGNGGPIGTPGMFKYSRDQESEADRIGQDLAVMTGIDPNGMASFMRSLDASTRLAQGYSRETSYFDTHPATRERAAEAATSAQVADWKPTFKIARDRREFLERMNGLTIGPPASEGVIEKNMFFHADLGIALRFPAGWEIVNTRSAVYGISPGRDGIVALEMHGEGDDPRAAAVAWADLERVELEKPRSTPINGLEAFSARASLPTPTGQRIADVTWIAYGGHIYRLTGFDASGRASLAGVYRGFPRGFRPIEPQELETISDLRMRIVEARSGETLAELSVRTGNAWELNATAVANEVRIDERLEAGSLVKVGIRERYLPASGGSATPAPTEAARREEPVEIRPN